MPFLKFDKREKSKSDAKVKKLSPGGVLFTDYSQFSESKSSSSPTFDHSGIQAVIGNYLLTTANHFLSSLFTTGVDGNSVSVIL